MYRRDLYVKRGPENGSSDYSYITDFIERKDGKMTAYSTLAYDSFEDKCDRHNRYKHYTKLTQFLKKAEYIGKKFRRTQPVKLYNEYHPIPIEMEYILKTSRMNNGARARRRRNHVPSCGIDRSYMIDNPDLIVLFATPELVLIEKTDYYLGKKRYEMLNTIYISDGNFEFYGEQIPQTKSKEDVLLEIMEQVESDKQRFEEEEKVKEKRRFKL